MSSTRRDWLSSCASLTVWAEIAAAQQHAQKARRANGAAPFDALSADTATEVEALTAQILPSTDGPGAREAGVIYFIDRALSTFESDKRDVYRAGMEAVQQQRRALFPRSESIAGLTPEQQIQLLRAIESTEFFEVLRTHTILGFLGNPSYGGNRERVGWHCIGFEDRMAFEPPFGYYDAQANGSAE